MIVPRFVESSRSDLAAHATFRAQSLQLASCETYASNYTLRQAPNLDARKVRVLRLRLSPNVCTRDARCERPHRWVHRQAQCVARACRSAHRVQVAVQLYCQSRRSNTYADGTKSPLDRAGKQASDGLSWHAWHMNAVMQSCIRGHAATSHGWSAVWSGYFDEVMGNVRI